MVRKESAEVQQIRAFRELFYFAIASGVSFREMNLFGGGLKWKEVWGRGGWWEDKFVKTLKDDKLCLLLRNMLS